MERWHLARAGAMPRQQENTPASEPWSDAGFLFALCRATKQDLPRQVAGRVFSMHAATTVGMPDDDMADASRYEISFEEIAVALVRQLDIHEGLWTLNVNFSFEAKNVATPAKPMRPGFLGALNHLSLVRVTTVVPGLTVNAARVNPRITATTESHRRSH